MKKKSIPIQPERKKPELIEGMFAMDHVPPPDPANFWKLRLNEPRVIMATRTADIEPLVTLTVREINGEEVSIQVTVSQKIPSFHKQ